MRRILLFSLLLSPSLLFSQTSQTGRIVEGTLAARPACPSVSVPGDKYIATDQNPVQEFNCSSAGWATTGQPASPSNSTQYNNGGAFGSNGPGLTGQIWTSNGAGSPPNMLSPGLLDCNGGAPITTTPYTLQADSGGLIDRAHVCRFQTGASVVNVPLSTAVGVTGGFVVTAIDESAGTLTFNRTSPDTFSIYNGSSATTGATSFTMANGQYATLNQGASGIWEIRISAGGAPVAPNFQAQVYNNGAFSNTPCFNVSAPASSSASSNLSCDNVITGPNPYYDVRAVQSTGAHVRAINPTAVPAVPGLTGNCVSGNNQIVMSAVTGLQVGDGIVARGCGAAPTLSTPGAPTVTTSVALAGTGTGYVATDAASGSTTYTYALVARDQKGQLTPASPNGSTTVGAATLGKNTAPITCTRSTDTVSCTLTSGTHNFNTSCSYTSATACGEILISGFSDPSFNGVWTIATAPTNTTFTWVSGYDTRNGATTSPTGATASGTAQWFNCNHLSWSQVTGAWEYYIYRNGNLIGVSRPNGPGAGGLSPELDLTFDDFGSPMMDGSAAAIPYWVPTTSAAASSATGQHLVTYITNIVGNTITVNTAPTSNVTGASIEFDNTAPALALYTTIASQGSNGAQGGTLYFPPDINNNEYVFNSYWNLLLTSPNRSAAIAQMGTIRLNDTMEIAQGQQWFCDRPFPQTGPSVTSWTIQQGAGINIVTANPGVYIDDLLRVVIRGCQFIGFPSNGAIDVLGEGAFNWSLIDDGFATGFNSLGGGSDYMGVGLYLRAGSAQAFSGVAPTAGKLERATFSSTLSFVPAYLSHTPSWMCQGCGDVVASDTQMTTRGILFRGNNASGVGVLQLTGNYSQGTGAPFVTGLAQANICLSNAFLDSQTSTLYSGLSLPTLVNPGTFGCSINSTLSLGNTQLSGSRFSSNNTQFPTVSNGFSSSIYPNRNGETVISAQTTQQVFGFDYLLERQLAGDLAIGNSYEAFIMPSTIAPPTCTVSSGGSHTLGTYVYRIEPEWWNGQGGGSSQNSAVCTYTTGNQTGTIAWTAVPGNPQGYLLIEDTQPGNGGGSFCSVRATPIKNTTITITAACNGGSTDSLPTGGPTMFMSNAQGAVAPQYLLPSPNFFADTITLPVSSGNYSIIMPDNRGTIPVSGYQNSVFDNFNRSTLTSGGPCTGGACWSFDSANQQAISGNLVQGNASGQYQGMYWNANTFSNDQYSSGMFITAGNGINPMVRYNATQRQAYRCFNNIALVNFGPQTLTVLASGLSVNTGDMLWEDIVENAAGTSATITCRDLTQGTSITATDSTIASGSPGLFAFSTGGQFDNWAGGNYHGIAQQDIEQNLQQNLHVAGALTVGPSEPTGTTGALPFGSTSSSTYNTNTNCAVNSTSPAACGSAAAGAFVVPTTTTTYTVNTTAVTSHSRIFLQPITFAADLPSSPTCVAPLLTTDYSVSAITAATSFTLTLTSTTGQTCWYYWIVN